MAEHSKFFDSLNPLDPDKVYTADEFMGFFGKLITDGVMKGEANMLKVETSGSNMNTIVDTGTAFLKAREYENDSKLSLTHEVEALGKSRIDRVVIRLMLNVDYREARAFVKKGVAGVAPVVPQLERTDDVYEISLAQVKVIGGQTFINVADVTDERGQEGVCPWAGSKILPNFDAPTLAELIKKVDTGLVDANTTRKGIVKLNDTMTSTSTTEAATPNAVKQLNDIKAKKTQEAWKKATPLNGWLAISDIEFYKDEFDVVHVKGMITSGITTEDTTLFTLPAGYRPSVAYVAGVTYSTSIDGRPIPITILNDRVNLNSKALGRILLDFSFRL